MSADEGRDDKLYRKRDGPSRDKKHKEHRSREKEARKEKEADRSRSAREPDISLEDDRKRKRDRDERDREKERERERDRERAERERRDKERRERERAERVEWERAEKARAERERVERERRDRGRDRDRGRRSRSRDRGRDRDYDDGRGKERAKRRRTEDGDHKRGDVDRMFDDVDAEAEKRRRRAKVWQLQKATEQAEEDAKAEALAAQQKLWSLEDEDDDEEEAQPAPPEDLEEGGDEVDPLDAFMMENEATAKQEIKAAAADDDVDPLDAFMDNTIKPALQQEGATRGVKQEAGAEETGVRAIDRANSTKEAVRPPRRRARPLNSDSSSGSDSEEEQESDDEAWAKDVTAGRKTKGDKLGTVDHSKINYEPFRRNFYIEVPDLAKMTPQEVAELRKSLDGIKVKGRDVPKPVKNWNQCGLSSRILEILRKNDFTGPMPIQAQALPVIMSGRDCIGVAKTGSGKTLAFILPMLRHIKDQRPLAMGEGPIALIMAPTRELVVQIGMEVRKFAGHLGLRHVCAYGGSNLGTQITELKRGCEIIVCSPGRLIDVLAMSGGKITNLRRVTYFVMDEADRMFDMGFEPQISRIISFIRPDRQTVLFSATFPKSVESLARQVLQAPVEIEIGGRSIVNKDIHQQIEIRNEGDRFMRLLEILGEYYEKGKVLVFVDKQVDCDDLFRDLLKMGYPCLSLHGGKDQSDRESTINDFKSDVCNLLVATSVAARGLDVKDLILVVNYHPPSHHEDYVHRVGRTGRAGNKGTAITFLSSNEEAIAPDLVKALKESGAGIPADLLEMATSFNEKRKAGQVQQHGSGYGGSGYKFNTEEDEQRKAARKAAAKDAARDAGMSDSDEEQENNEIRLVKPGEQAAREAAAAAAAANAAYVGDMDPEVAARRKAAEETAARLTMQAFHSAPTQQAGPYGTTEISPLVAAAQAVANKLAGYPAGMGVPIPSYPILPSGIPTSMAPPQKEDHYELELLINDFPQHARWKVTHKDSMAAINELTGAAVTTKGRYFAPGQAVPEGEQKLHLLIEGPTQQVVKLAKAEIKRILEESTERAFQREAPTTGRYNVL